MKKISFAIIGCGQIAQRHAKQIHTYGALIAVCDTVAEKANRLALEYNVPPFFSIEALLTEGLEIDVMVICTPNGLHAAHGIQCLDAGYHVLVEKPMALTSEDCEKMTEAAAHADRKIFTVVQNRFNKPVLAVKKALAEKAFGNISSVQITCLWNRPDSYYNHPWHGDKELDGGILFTQFSHFIDLLYWFFGDVKKIEAITRNAQHKNTTIEDCGVASLQFENGIIGTIHFSVNSFAKNYEGSLTILGDKGMAKIGGEYLNTIEYAAFHSYEMKTTSDDRAANDYGLYKGSMSNHDKVYQNLIATLQDFVPFYASVSEAMKTVEIIEKIYASANHLSA